MIIMFSVSLEPIPHLFKSFFSEASEGNCFIFKNGDKPSRMIIILGKYPPNYYPGQCFSPKALLLETYLGLLSYYW